MQVYRQVPDIRMLAAYCLSTYSWETPDNQVTKNCISVQFEEAVDKFKESVIALKKHIFSKRVQSRTYNQIETYLDHGKFSCMWIAQSYARMYCKMRLKALALEAVPSVFSQHVVSL